jgi:lantibiotic leader peptide-processing serine protease
MRRPVYTCSSSTLPGDNHAVPGAVAAKINNTADPMACPPDLSIYAFFSALDNGVPQVCQGGTAYNSFNGHGQVNALAAVTR